MNIFGLRIKNIVFILLGAAIFSFGIVHFNMQHNLGKVDLQVLHCCFIFYGESIQP